MMCFLPGGAGVLNTSTATLTPYKEEKFMGIGTFLSGNVKCDNCGEFMKNLGGNNFLNNSGFGVLSNIAYASKKNFCSDRCKREYNGAHGGGSGSGGSSGGYSAAAEETKMETARLKEERKNKMVDAFTSAFDTKEGDQMLKDILAKKAEAKAEAKADKDNIINVKFGDSADEISDTINQLLTKAATLKTGFMASSNDKQMKALIIEKAEFGILKLRKQDADTADFFQKKLDDLQKKK